MAQIVIRKQKSCEGREGRKEARAALLKAAHDHLAVRRNVVLQCKFKRSR